MCLAVFIQPAREARRLLHRNGNFVPLAPWTRTRRRVKMGFRRKTGRSRAVYESIRKIPTGKTKQISVASQPSIRFFPLMARNGPFRPFFGPQGAKMGNPLLSAHPEGATGRPSRVHPGHPFPIWLWGFMSENAIRARFGGPRAETGYGKRPKTAVGHCTMQKLKNWV